MVISTFPASPNFREIVTNDLLTEAVQLPPAVNSIIFSLASAMKVISSTSKIASFPLEPLSSLSPQEEKERVMIDVMAINIHQAEMLV